MSLTVMVPQP